MDDRRKAYQLALQNEKLAQKLYEVLAKACGKNDSHSIFEQLASMEKQHEEKIVHLFRQEFPNETLHVDTKELQQMSCRKNLKDGKTALDFAIQNEEKAAQLYDALAEKSTENTSLFQQFAKEERNHKKLLEAEISRITGIMTWFDESELNGMMEY